MKILDCTLRDGGYYTNWDFNKNLVYDYFTSLNHLPIDYIEIGYRSFPQKEYLGEFFYCPDYVIEKARTLSDKKLAIMLNEKDVRDDDVFKLLNSATGKIDLVRLAVDPQNILRAVKSASAIRKLGFEVGFNVMYMSKWKSQTEFLDNLKVVNGVINYFYMVDSFGGIYPDDVKQICELISERVKVPFGFHGHNNMEMALINSLTAIENGAELLDSTITGMGRGAGNLKTELLLTALNARGIFDFDYNYLSKVVDDFSKLQEQYRWGTNLPYIVSGANSLPQKDVMEWVGKRYYSFNSIIRALSNTSKGVKDNINLEEFNPKNTFKNVLIIGGGPSAIRHSQAINEFINNQTDICLIHSSSKNARVFKDVNQTQYHCLSGNEGYRLEKTFSEIKHTQKIAILPPYPRTMGTYLPKELENNAYQLKEIVFTTEHKESATALAIQTALLLKSEVIYFVGYDGYEGDIKENEFELYYENDFLFETLKNDQIPFFSITPTKYKNISVNSIYSQLI